MTVGIIIGVLAAGAAAGVSSAALGIGGGIIMVPAFLHLFPGMEMHTAKGTSLLAIMFISAANAWRLSHRNDDKMWGTAAVIAAAAMVGAYLATWVTALFSPTALAWGFVVLVALAVVRLVQGRQRYVRDEDVRPNKPLAGAIGLGAGVISGSAGVGGGIVIVPLGLIAGIVSNARVSALSNMVMVPTSAAAAIAHAQAPEQFTSLAGTVGQTNLLVALLAVVGAQAGSPLGKKLNAHLTFKRRRLLLVVILAAVAGRMAYYALRG